MIDTSTGALIGTVGPLLQGWGKPVGHMAVDEKHGLLFVVLGNTRYVGVIDLVKLQPLAVFASAACPFAVALDVARGRGYVTGTTAAELAVFDLKKVYAALGRS